MAGGPGRLHPWTPVLLVAVLAPALGWSSLALFDLVRHGPYGYSTPLPLPFRLHTVTLLNAGLFHLAAVGALGVWNPVRAALIAASWLFLTNAWYEFVFAAFYDPRGMIVAGPLVVAGVALVWLGQRTHPFLRRGWGRLVLTALLLASFLSVMLVLHRSGFFERVREYLDGTTSTNPHDLWWVLSKTLALWVPYPLLGPSRRHSVT